MEAESAPYLHSVDFALGRKPIGEFVAWCKAAALGAEIRRCGNLCFARRRRDWLHRCQWRCADVLGDRIPDGLTAGCRSGGLGMTDSLICHEHDSWVIAHATSGARSRR